MSLELDSIRKKLNESKVSSSKLQQEQSAEREMLEAQVRNKLNEKEHGARNLLTTSFIGGIFVLIILAAIYVPLHNDHIMKLAILAQEKKLGISEDKFILLSFESIFSLIFNALGPPLGFIIGYYFKEKVVSK